jgi:Carboxypeptidase regulatory-like domain
MKTGKTNPNGLRSFALVGAFLLLSAGAAFAQAGRGGISGLVSDPSGAAVPGAKVTLLDHATGVEQTTATTNAGLYSFVSLAPGNYRVTVAAQGFETAARDNVAVTVDQVSAINIALRVGNVSETVTLT